MKRRNIPRTVIVADGNFPKHHIPLAYLRNAERIVCCDGSVKKLVKAGFTPDAIVGDMDSLSDMHALRYRDRIYEISEQETNDLTKSVNWCIERGYNDLVIVGATGQREDHTLGNISLLAEYIQNVNVIMVTDTGLFLPLLKGSEISSFPGQQVSVFSIDPATEITSSGLRYPLNNTKLGNWWMATLNEATAEKFNLAFDTGKVLVFLKFSE
ncbi:MAG TPA: thiamine diphosphokinase [Bacteroidales bacterium]|nr:thiamine diphosphokinase [Bacteroidales bacterium]